VTSMLWDIHGNTHGVCENADRTKVTSFR
jgi:hypothetical protein